MTNITIDGVEYEEIEDLEKDYYDISTYDNVQGVKTFYRKVKKFEPKTFESRNRKIVINGDKEIIITDKYSNDFVVFGKDESFPLLEEAVKYARKEWGKNDN